MRPCHGCWLAVWDSRRLSPSCTYAHPGIVDGIVDTVPVSCTPYDSDADGLRDMPNVSVAVGGVDTVVPVTVSDAVPVMAVTVTVSDAVPVITVTVSDTDMVSVALGGIVDGMCVVDGICVTEGGM